MAGFSDYLEGKLLDHVLQGGAMPYTAPASLFVGLHTGDPGDDGVGLELSGMSYIRKAVTFTPSDPGPVANVSLLNWTNLPAGNIAWIVVHDAETGGNALFLGALLEPRGLNAGDTFSINPGSLDISLD